MLYSGYRTAYSVKQCEKIDPSSPNLTWNALPDMKSNRCWFTPCLFNAKVYLCGGVSPTIEEFSPQTENFFLLPLNFSGCNFCSTYVHNNCLVVHASSSITKFSVGPAGQLVLHSEVHYSTSVSKWSSVQPVLDSARGLFFICQGLVCNSFNIETGAIVQSFS